jgi:hypothetical protein
MLTWRIAGTEPLSDGKSVVRAAAGWLAHDLVIACLVYAVFYVTKGARTISFSAVYPTEEIDYSIYDIGFVLQYSVFALCVAAALGILERLLRKLIGRRK